MCDSRKDVITFSSSVSKEDQAQCASYTSNTEVLKAHEYCYSGPFTRGVKKSLQTAISSGRVCAPSTTRSISVPANTTSSLLTSQSSFSTQTSTYSPINLLSSTFTLSALETGRALACNNVTRSQSIIAHILTGEDKNLGANTMTDNSGSIEVFSDDEKPFAENQTSLDAGNSDVDNFMDDTLRSNSIIGKFANFSTEWDTLDCHRKEITLTPDHNLASSMDRMSCMKTWSKCSTFLIVQNEVKGAELRQEIIQALKIPDIKVIKLHEVTDVRSDELWSIIWVYVPIPIQDELLAVVASLKYSNKRNKGAFFIAITDQQSDVDLHLLGFDEVYVEPIPKDAICLKYKKFQFMTLPEELNADNVEITRDITSTPESTVSIESGKTTEYSQSSTCDSVSSGMDTSDINISGLKSTLSVPLCSKPPFLSEHTEKEVGRSSSPAMDPQSPPSWCRVEHATKEKQRSLARRLPAHTEKERRERIKDSCDQLRVLLPYVKGRKTDMASILEMTVDYLKIVNAALPQDFQSHVIDIMSNGTPMMEGKLGEIEKITMANKKGTKRRAVDLDTSPPCKLQHNVENMQANFECSSNSTLNNKIITRSQSSTDNYTLASDKINSNANTSIVKCFANYNTNSTDTINGPAGSKRECSILTKTGSNKSKRPHMPVVSPSGNIHSPAVVYLPTGNITPIKETKKESIPVEVPGQGHQFTGSQFSHMFSDGEVPANRTFSTNNMNNDIFPYQNHTQVNTTTSRVSAGDRGDLTNYGGMYFDGAFYHYYSPLQDSGSGNYFIPGGSNEYVNPNAVLPMTSYTPRPSAFSTSRKFDRGTTDLDRFVMSGQNSDIFSNSSITGLKPNNI